MTVVRLMMMACDSSLWPAYFTACETRGRRRKEREREGERASANPRRSFGRGRGLKKCIALYISLHLRCCCSCAVLDSLQLAKCRPLPLFHRVLLIARDSFKW